MTSLCRSAVLDMTTMLTLHAQSTEASTLCAGTAVHSPALKRYYLSLIGIMFGTHRRSGLDLGMN